MNKTFDYTVAYSGKVRSESFLNYRKKFKEDKDICDITAYDLKLCNLWYNYSIFIVHSLEEYKLLKVKY